MALSRSSIPEIASARSSRWSVDAVSASATTIPTRSPGVRVSFLIAFSMAFRIACPKYRLGYGRRFGS